jgi:hypothetical protein
MKGTSMKSVYRAAALILILLLITPAGVQAAAYRDVPPSHFAFTAVDWVSNPANGSFMVGDASNNFHPTRTLDKFETAKIFAMAAGYKYAANAISPAEQELFDRSYGEWKALLDGIAAQYARWNKTADREIAYLLHKNILNITDVNRFIVKNNNTETVTTLTKQEAIAYMVRLDGRQAAASAIVLPYHTPYRDDANIQADFKKYIYYARESGIAGGSDGFINPERPFTRAEMAQLFYNTLAHSPSAAPANPVSQAPGVSVSGVIDYVFLNTHVYILTDSRPRSFQFANNAVIMVDNINRTAGFLTKGMSVTALTNNSGEIVSLTARSAETPAPVSSAAPAILYENEGYVVSVSSAAPPAVTIRTQRVRLTGEIVTDEKPYTLADKCVIRRGDAEVAFTDIKVNDIIIFKHSGSEISDISLEEKNRTVNGTLTEKKINAANNTVFLVVEDAKNVKYELRVTQNTRFSRNDASDLSWNDLRIGDTVEAECEYDVLIAVTAAGERTTVNGRLEEIRLSQNEQQIILRQEDGSQAVYTISLGGHDMYSLRIGMTLRLYLDSLEIYGIDIISQ